MTGRQVGSEEILQFLFICCVSQRVWKISRKPSVVAYFPAYSFLPLFSCTFLEASSLVNVPDDTNSMTALKLPLDPSVKNTVAVFSKCGDLLYWTENGLQQDHLSISHQSEKVVQVLFHCPKDSVSQISW